MVDPEERSSNRREETTLFVIDRIIQADRDSAQRSSYLAGLHLGETLRAGLIHGANQSSKSVMVCTDLS
ncbi:hypothetical protein, partial [Candidatus Binatus sp.]|uniref:hypothetical protein n=1 Tax=Candidatus Binatus sp. TaxID=2811406 RepID=UPI003C9AFE0C